MNFNMVQLGGNITRDPELKYLPSQTACTEFGLAINRKWNDTQGVAKEEVTFVDCTAFGKTAESIAKHCKKGNGLFVVGRLKLDQWEAQDGTKRNKMRVVVETMQFIGGKPQGEAAPQGQQRQQYRGRAPAGGTDHPPAGGVGGEAESGPQDDGMPQSEDIPF